MFGILVLLFILLPMAELYLLLWMAGQVGGGWTFALVIFTGMLGAWLCRLQGFRTMTRINNEFAGGKMPTDSLMDGGMILVSAALLVTPGIMTDVFGFSLLFPPCRAVYRKVLARWMKGRFQFQTFSSTGANPEAYRRWGGQIDPNVVEGQVVDSDDSPTE